MGTPNGLMMNFQECHDGMPIAVFYHVNETEEDCRGSWNGSIFTGNARFGFQANTILFQGECTKVELVYFDDYRHTVFVKLLDYHGQDPCQNTPKSCLPFFRTANSNLC